MRLSFSTLAPDELKPEGRMLEPVDDVDPDEPGLDRVLEVGVPQRVRI